MLTTAMEHSNLIALCVFCYGIVQALPKVLIQTATEDIMAGTLIQSSTVIILFSIADVLSKICSPLLIRKISFLPTIIVIGFVWLISYVLVVAVDNVVVRLVGVFFYGIGNGLTDILLWLLLGYYNGIHKNTNAFFMGQSASHLLAAFLYTGSTVWHCFSPRITMAVVLPLAFLIIIFYGILNHGPLKHHQIVVHKTDCGYAQLTSFEEKQHQSRTSEHLQFIFKVFPFPSYHFINYLVYYLAANAVLTTRTFPSGPFRVRDIYQYQRLAADIGQVFGSLALMFLSRVFPQIKSFFSHVIWIVVLVHVGHLIFFLFDSWYHFVPNAYIILLLSGTHGILIVTLCVLILSSAAECFVKSRDRGTAMAITEAACSMGRLVAGLLGIFIEDYLRHHCTNELLMGEFCLARFPSTAGWSKNLNCF